MQLKTIIKIYVLFQVWHFKKGVEICNYDYQTEILSVRLNRNRLAVCLRDSIYVHNIRDMKLINSIRHTAQNDNGLCSLSLMSHLAFPVSNDSGELQIYDAADLQMKIKIKAHDSPLSAFNFSPNGKLLATASEKGMNYISYAGCTDMSNTITIQILFSFFICLQERLFEYSAPEMVKKSTNFVVA